MNTKSKRISLYVGLFLILGLVTTYGYEKNVFFLLALAEDVVKAAPTASSGTGGSGETNSAPVETRTFQPSSSEQTATTLPQKTEETKRTAVTTITVPPVSLPGDAAKTTAKQPETKITTPSAQTGTLQLSTEAGQQATQVEYYSQRKETGVKTYLGTAEKQKVPSSSAATGTTTNKANSGNNANTITNNSKTSGGTASTTANINTDSSSKTNAGTGSATWNLQIDSKTRIPTGDYQVSAEIKKEDGSTEQGRPAEVRVEHSRQELSAGEKKKLERSQADSDQDGVIDTEEIKLGTNPTLADSDNDGFLDGDEIKNGFNPMQFSSGDKSDKKKFETPKEVARATETSKKIRDESFKVEKIEKVTSPTTGAPVTRFSGKALPDIFITVYIYSDPIIITVKTDSDGNWTYDLDKELPDGDHEVYVAVTDNVGKITAQSEALPFVKTAQAINIKPAQAAADAENNLSPIEQSRTEFIIIGLVIALTFLGIGIVVIGRKTTSV